MDNKNILSLFNQYVTSNEKHKKLFNLMFEDFRRMLVDDYVEHYFGFELGDPINLPLIADEFFRVYMDNIEDKNFIMEGWENDFVKMYFPVNTKIYTDILFEFYYRLVKDNDKTQKDWVFNYLKNYVG